MIEDADALRNELAELRLRVDALQSERDGFAEINAALFVLQQVFSTMNSTLEIDDILATVLRGVSEALKFGRVVLFDVDDGIPSPRLETDADGTVVPSPSRGILRDSVAFRDVASGTSEFALGDADDGDSPLEDAEGTFCMLPLISRNTVRGILYVDRPPEPTIAEAQIHILLDFGAQAAIAMENARLYSETKRLLDETKRLASTDALTGLANRRALNELTEREIRNARRYGNPLAFFVLDLDDLKKINDTLGHHAGDQAIQRFADVLRTVARGGDILARYAGDEFVLVAVHADRPSAEAVMRRLFGSLGAFGLSCSVGVALFPLDAADGDGLFSAADRALYRVKQAGKNGFRFASDPA